MSGRTLAQIREHYEIEKELAGKLRNSSQAERRSLYGPLYDELFQRVPLHPQLTQKQSAQDKLKEAKHQLSFLRRFLAKEAIFLEIGPGDCALSFAVAHRVRKVYGVEVSAEITKNLACPQNFELILSNGSSILLPANSVNLAYSNQLMEHLHPDDALEQLSHIYSILTKQGKYICITPNRLSGPHDVSGYFDEVATGFHLKEYTHRDLSDLFTNVGFSQIRAYVGAAGIYVRFPLSVLRLLESVLDSLSYRIRKKIACLCLLNIRLVGIK
jgi:SAM-dependent methyltransferase